MHKSLGIFTKRGTRRTREVPTRVYQELHLQGLLGSSLVSSKQDPN